MERVIVGITGASGAIYGERAVEVLVSNGYAVDVIFSKVGKKVFEYELKSKVEEFLSKFPKEKVRTFDYDDLFALPSSGSYRVLGMIVIPCSAGTLSHIANGITENLIHRAADVCLKERRPLVLVLRETPLNRIHIENMLKIVDAGGIVFPACPAFYSKPKTINHLVDFVVERSLRLLVKKEFHLIKNWGD
ncbi:MAG: UbiX family flavin prenyltransferase [Desulfurobacteriaceae bacterium]